MARNKNSTALFDVIHSAKKPPKASPSASIPTPKWWGKDKKVPKAPAPESTENAGRQQSWLSAAKKSAGFSATTPPVVTPALEPETSTSSQPVIQPFYTEQASVEIESEPLDTSAEIEITNVYPSQPKPRFIDRFKNRPAKPTPIVEEVIAPPAAVDEPSWTESPEPEIKPARQHEPRESAIKLDSTAHEIKFNLSYGGLAAIVFFLIIALVFAFVVGTRSNTQALLDNSSSDMGGAPSTNPTSGMMAAMEPAAKTSPPATIHPDVLQVLPRSQRPAPTPSAVAPAPTLPIKSTRDIGMIYVVVQSYAEQELAQRACDFMNKSGIPCSLVQGPDGWAPRDWYSVIGLQPFAKHDPALPEYERSIKAAGIRFTTKIMDQFQPQGYTWRDTSDLSQQ